MVKKAAKKTAIKKPVKKIVKKVDPKRQTGSSDKSIDKKVQAKTPGKRIAKASKKIYYERRANRSDKGNLLGIGAVKKELANNYKTAVENVAWLTGAIATEEIILAHAAAANRPKIKERIAKLQMDLKLANVLKKKLSKFK